MYSSYFIACGALQLAGEGALSRPTGMSLTYLSLRAIERERKEGDRRQSQMGIRDRSRESVR